MISNQNDLTQRKDSWHQAWNKPRRAAAAYLRHHTREKQWMGNSVTESKYSFTKRRSAHLRLGARGERIAAEFLQDSGLELLVRNYRCNRGEIDLICREQGVLCFIEVKTRRRLWHGSPGDAVGSAKRRRIIAAAKHYLREIGWPQLPYRYDIAEIIMPTGKSLNIRYFRGAFTEEKQKHDAVFPTLIRE